MKHCGEVFGRWRGVGRAVALSASGVLEWAVASCFLTGVLCCSDQGCSRLYPRGYSLQERGRSICLSLGGATANTPITMLRDSRSSVASSIHGLCAV